MSSSLPLSFVSLPKHHKSSKTPPQFKINIISFPNFSKSTSKSHICFTFNNNSSENDREEIRWLREEQRWLREEQRWIREEKRWENERETLLNEITHLKDEIAELRRVGSGGGSSNTNSNNSVANLLRLLLKEKEVSRIGESGSSASRLVVEADAVDDVVEEVVVKEVVDVLEEVKVNEKEVMKKRSTLRVGSEGDQVQMLQEALLKLGFYCGEEDEEFSSFSTGTERAVTTWQASIGVPETGVMTAELLEILFMDQQETTSDLKEGANGVAVTTSVTQVPEIPSKTVKEDPEPYVSDNRVYLLGENRWEDSSRLKNQSSQSQTDSKGVVTTKCITCRGVGRLLCLECDGTGEPNIEPQFLEWVGEDTKCPYCEGVGHTSCDVCLGSGITSA